MADPRSEVGPDAAVGFVAADADHRWRVAGSHGAVEVTDPGDLPAAVASGSGHDLLVFLWGRTTGEDLDVAGDRASVDAWKIPA